MTNLNMKLRKPIYGVGINDADYVTQPREGDRCPYFDRWHSMLRRCYSEKSKLTNPTYEGAVVHENWHLFSNFKAWMEKQDWEGNALDKDLLGDGKIYSEDTCVFLPSNINGFINESSGTKYPLGVHLKFTDGRLNCFVAQTMVEDKKTHLGVFSDELSAHRSWQMAKIKEVSRLIDKYTDYFTDRKVIYALTNIKDRISLELREHLITESVVDASLNKVRMFALNYHKDQKYGEKPYSYHLDSVASKCKFLYGYDEALAMVAYNHDNLEDTDCEYETIGHACGWKVADAVVSVTKVKGESYRDYIKRVRANDLGLKVKIADTLCNLEESIKISDMKRIKKYTKQLQLLCE